MPWVIRKPGSAIRRTIAKDGDDELVAVFRVPDRQKALDIAEQLDGAAEADAVHAQRVVIGHLLDSIEGAVTEDGEPFVIEKDIDGALSAATTDCLVPHLTALFAEAMSFLNAKGLADVKN